MGAGGRAGAGARARAGGGAGGCSLPGPPPPLRYGAEVVARALALSLRVFGMDVVSRTCAANALAFVCGPP
eukprot:8860477-Alexandrium_andersonii.AAC.1